MYQLIGNRYLNQSDIKKKKFYKKYYNIYDNNCDKKLILVVYKKNNI